MAIGKLMRRLVRHARSSAERRMEAHRWWRDGVMGAGLAHARPRGMRNHVALCGAYLSPYACLAYDEEPRCPRCGELARKREGRAPGAVR